MPAIVCTRGEVVRRSFGKIKKRIETYVPDIDAGCVVTGRRSEIELVAGQGRTDHRIPRQSDRTGKRLHCHQCQERDKGQ